MTIPTEDKEFISSEVAKLVSLLKPSTETAKPISVPPSGGDHHNEYLLHLYDQLWENMRAKENRLWSFLALYGAAVGLVFAGGQTSQTAGADIFALIIVLALSTWAVLIILNANWWVRRNLLMVGGIEDRFKEIKPGIYPKRFPDSKGGFDVLYRGSILVLSVLLIILYARTTWSYRNGASLNAFHILAGITVAYLLFTAAALFCLLQHESYVRLLHLTNRSIFDRAEKLTPARELEMLQNEIEDRAKLSARPHLIMLLLVAAGCFDLVLYTNGLALIADHGLGLWIVISLQILLFTLYVILWLRYRRPFSDQCFHNTAQKVIEEESLAVSALLDGDALIESADLAEKLRRITQRLEDLSNLLKNLRDERSSDMKTNIKQFDENLAEVIKERNKATLDKALLAAALKKTANSLKTITINKLLGQDKIKEDSAGNVVKDRLGVMGNGLCGFQDKNLLWPLALIVLASAIFPVSYLSSTSAALRSEINRTKNSPSTADIRAQADEAEALLKKLRDTQSKLETTDAQQAEKVTIKRELDEALKNFVTKQDLKQQLDKDRKSK